jgi:hypothetical protein
LLSRLSRFPALARIAAFGVVVALPALALSVGSSPACAIYDSSLLLPGDGGDGSTPARMHAVPPPPPVTLSEGGTVASYVFAITSIDIGVSDGGVLGPDANAPLAPFGFDLDNRTTCPDKPSCQQSPRVPEICDDDAGRDHIALQLFRDLGMTARNGSETANAAMRNGQFGMLLQVSDYNGGENDLVTAALYVSNGINGVQDGGMVTPLHNGNDGWTVDPSYLAPMQDGRPVPAGTQCFNTGACQPLYVDTSAYVTGYKLVAHLGKVPLTFGYRANIGGAVMTLDSVIISGTLVPATITGVGTGFAITDGSISGRWETTQLLANMATIPDPFIDGSFFCGQDILYLGFKPFICNLRDINHDPLNDNTMPLSSCDSLSMGFAFTAEPARLDVVYPPPSLPPAGCTDEAGTAWHDQCQ